MKKLISSLLAFIMALSLSVSAFAKETDIVTSFSDVPTSHWGHSDIMAMTRDGLFNGVSDPVNGVGVFAPTNTMKRSEFVTVVMRALYSDELNAMPKSDVNWWDNVYSLALEKGILQPQELDYGALDKGMNRQEMALVLARALDKLGQYPSQLISTSKIPDYYTTVGDYYRDSVRIAFSMGLINGKDSSGTFFPLDTMQRDHGAAVLNRLINPSARVKVDFTVPSPSDVYTDAITIYEGQVRTNRLARAGDTVIKADGTKVVLTTTRIAYKAFGGAIEYYDVLGAGQGVAPDLGLTSPNKVHVVQDNIHEMFGYDMGKDSTGTNVKQSHYTVNNLTGEGHWDKEWSVILMDSYPDYKGKSNKELSADKNWVWMEINKDWFSVPGQNYFKSK